ncbi:MAG: NAD(P)H-dependent oxidoreductase [Patescibacteria group bacterium]|jgi:nitroreductase
MKTAINSLLWRYATKKYNTEKKLSSEQLEGLMEAIRLSPSSFGLQSFKVLVITKPEIREKLKIAAFGQPQITDASHLLVFAIEKDLGEKHVDEYMEEISKTRGVPVAALKDFESMIKNTISSRTNEQRQEWAARQAYLALGVLLTAAAEGRIDASPMEGFNPAEFDKILGLEEKGLKTVVIAAVGFRDESDDYLKLAKVRLPKEKFFHIV